MLSPLRYLQSTVTLDINTPFYRFVNWLIISALTFIPFQMISV